MDISGAAQLLEDSRHAAILLPTELDADILCSAEALGRTLRARGTHAGLLRPLPTDSLPHRMFSFLASSPQLLREFIVSVAATPNPISELRYEKLDDRIEIILSPQSGQIGQDAVSFRDGTYQCDLVIALGIADIESIPEPSGIAPDFFTKTRIINLDTSAANTGYGEANLIGTDTTPLSHITFGLISQWRRDAIDQDIATLLLTGILSRTQAFRAPGLSADILQSSAELLRMGASHLTSHEILGANRSLPLFQLFGRASIRSKIQAGHDVLWSFLTAEDFEKTGRGVDDIGLVVRHLRAEFPTADGLLLLWQDPADRLVRAALAGEERMLNAVKSSTAADSQSPYLNLTTPYPTFQDAERDLSALLAEVL